MGTQGWFCQSMACLSEALSAASFTCSLHVVAAVRARSRTVLPIAHLTVPGLCVTVTITGPNNTVKVVSTANVSDASLSASCAAPKVSLQSFSGNTASFTDAASPSGTNSDFSATINWGDASSSAGTIVGADGRPSYGVTGTHTYSSTGYFIVTAKINDVGGSTATAICSMLVFAFAGSEGFVTGDKTPGPSVNWWGQPVGEEQLILWL